MEPICLPFGPQKSTKTQKVPPKVALFAPSQKHLKFRRFLNPPEPSESSWRLHKTSIFTFSPYPQNRLQSTSQNLPFGHLWAPKPPKVPEINAPENTLKNTIAKKPKRCQNDFQNTLLIGPETPLFPFLFPDLPPRGALTPKYLIFHKNILFFIYFLRNSGVQVPLRGSAKVEKRP